MYPVRDFGYATIVNAVDGDTVDVEVDLGFSVRVKHRFRLIGIDTPERGKPGWQEATDLVKGHVGRACRLEVTKLDKYGRYLAEVFVDGVSLNKSLIEKGLAVSYF